MIRPSLLTTEDAEAWRQALPADVCVMGSLDYVRIEEQHSGQMARLFVFESGGRRIAYPFFLRPIPERPLIVEKVRRDTTTPDYTGPLLFDPGTGEHVTTFPGNFTEAFDRFCDEQGIVAEFAHLNPWSTGLELLDPQCIEANREIVYIDLTQGEEALWMHSLSSDTRRQTKQAITAGVQARRATSFEDVQAFHRLHQQTMERRSAMERYFLPEEYFVAIYKTMPQNAFFMLSEYQGKIIAGGLYFQDATDVYWHLSAFDIDYSKVRPVNAFHFESIKQSAQAGKKRLLCGGAHQPGDGVFRFKAGFSPLRVQFNTYRRIHAPADYAALSADWSRRHGGVDPQPGFFPAYRAPVAEETNPGILAHPSRQGPQATDGMAGPAPQRTPAETPRELPEPSPSHGRDQAPDQHRLRHPRDEGCLNVLLTSIGRRVSLARAFRTELAAFSPGGRVLGADLSPLSAGLNDADEGFLVPPTSDPDYIHRLLEIVRRQRVKIIIPLIDPELGILSKNRAAFLREGCHVIVSDLEQVLITRDKARSVERFRELGLAAPRVLAVDARTDLEALTYPLFLKPSDGSGSVGATRIDDAGELRWHLDRVKAPVVQTLEEGEEFTIDVFADLQGVVRCAVPRRRLETRAGEISKGITVKDRAMMEAATKLVTRLGGCRGCITLQCFRQPGDRFMFFEANLRFGGGYPLSYAAGANYPAWILRMVAGEAIPAFEDWEDNLTMLRFDDAVFVRGLGA